VRQKMAETHTRGKGFFSDATYVLTYITNDSMLVPMHEEDLPGIFLSDVESTSIEDGASTAEAKEVKAIVQMRIAGQPASATVDVCLDSTVPAPHQSVTPLRAATVLVDDCELKLALDKVTLPKDKLEQLLAQKDIRTKMEDELEKIQERVTKLTSLIDNTKTLRSHWNMQGDDSHKAKREEL